jgi:hypothetical protein
MGGSINDGFVAWGCVYAAPSSHCAGAIFADYFIFLNGLAVTYFTDWLVRLVRMFVLETD